MKRQVRTGEQSFNEEAPLLFEPGGYLGGGQLELSSLFHLGLMPRQTRKTCCDPFPWIGNLPSAKRTSVYYLHDDDEDDEDEDEDDLLWLFTVFGKMPFAI